MSKFQILVRLRNALTHEIIEPTFTYRGHAVAYPCYKKWLVHRLVAIAFIPNLNNLPEVNHKDCNQKNAAADNLEWCTHKQNEAYKYQGPNAEQNKESQRKRAIGTKDPSVNIGRLMPKYVKLVVNV